MTTHEEIAPQSADLTTKVTPRLGVVDVGSNALRTMIAEIAPSERGSVRVIESHREPVRLGHDVFLGGRIPESKLVAVVEVMTRFAARCRDLGVGKIAAIGTSAVRDARNQDELLTRVRVASGIDIEIITGSQEAYLLTAAVRSRVDIHSGRSILVDLGGGSVEVSLVEAGEIVHSESYRLGALRILHALEGTVSDTPAKGFVELVDQYVRAVEDRIRDHFGGRTFDRYVATGGNIDSVADLLKREAKTRTLDGVDVCRLDDIRDLTARLAELHFEERCARFELRPDRADTILQAAVVYYRIGRVAQVEEIMVPRVGMRDGLLQELVAETVRHSKQQEHRESLLSTCRALGRRYHCDAQHAERVRQHALSLFDVTIGLHDGRPKDRTLLEAAALLHDIGVFVNNASHHKHTWYLIRESDFPGIDSQEREIVAQVARYHRRAHPSRRHAAFDELAATDRDRVRRLAALLRIADVLDRSHMGKITGIDLQLDDRALHIVPLLVDGADRDITLERLGIAEKTALFTEVFDRRVVLEARSP